MLLDDLKQYLRVDWYEDDIFLESLIVAAINYIKTATGVDVVESNDLHKFAVCLLCTHWYENRNTVLIGQTSSSLDFSLQSILSSMQFGSNT